jgi:hypothetical protein
MTEFGAKRPLIHYSRSLKRYVPTTDRSYWGHFDRDEHGRDALGARDTGLVYVKPSNFLSNPLPFTNEAGDIEKRDAANGDGLYAKRALPKHTVIAEYRGRVIDGRTRVRGNSQYRFVVEDAKTEDVIYTIDGKVAKNSSIARYANAVDSLFQQNAVFVQFPPHGAQVRDKLEHRIFLVAKKRLEQNEEILAWYGPDTALIIDAPALKPSGLYTVDRVAGEKLVSKGKAKGTMQYLVKWAGYGTLDDTWEPEEELPECVLNKWHKDRDRGSSSSFGARTRQRVASPRRPMTRPSTYVARSRVCDGDGLFAARPIAAGREVVRMRMPHAAKGPRDGMDLDTIVYLGTNGMRDGVLDYAWTRGQPKPAWYLMNHSGHANARPVHEEGGPFVWKATRPIDKDEEIFWNYDPGRKVTFDDN